MKSERRWKGSARLPLSGSVGWHWLARIDCQRWLGVEGVDMRRTTIEKEVNNSLGPPKEMRTFCSQRRTGRPRLLVSQQMR
jgi:hypothetical protein